MVGLKLRMLSQLEALMLMLRSCEVAAGLLQSEDVRKVRGRLGMLTSELEEFTREGR
jgi:hypothetical protein